MLLEKTVFKNWGNMLKTTVKTTVDLFGKCIKESLSRVNDNNKKEIDSLVLE